MFYYLEDHATKLIVANSFNIATVTNLKSGLLDCHVKHCDNDELNRLLDEHFKHFNGKLGIGINQNLEPIRKKISEDSTISKKINLAILRKPCFVELLKQISIFKIKNFVGFSHGDELAINYALNDQYALKEYAELNEISIEFAKKELQLISQSAIADNFRVFAMATKIKRKINEISSVSEVDQMLSYIVNSFQVPGVLHE